MNWLRNLFGWGASGPVERPATAPAPVIPAAPYNPPQAAPSPVLVAPWPTQDNAPMNAATGPLTAAKLRKISPTLVNPERWAKALNEAMAAWQITTPARELDFVTQTAFESNGYKSARESLNYDPPGLLRTFNRKTIRITPEQAQQYGRTAEHPADQETIANIVYGGEFGLRELGNRTWGDGWKWRGAGPIQATGLRNVEAIAKKLGIPLADMEAFMSTPEGGSMASAYWWHLNGLNALADGNRFTDETVRINGSDKTVPDRLVMRAKVKNALA